MSSPPLLRFLIPYLGPLPAYAELFFRSCAFNTRVELLLVTDQPPRLALPPAVKLLVCSRQDVVKRIEEGLGIDLGGRIGGHKLCDFKPHYGTIFADWIGPETPWWGFCDLDMMFGDLDRWISDTIRGTGGEAFNIYTAHDRIIAGHFTVVRNLPAVNQAIRSMVDQPGMKARFQHPTCQMLDEYPFLEHVRRHPALVLRMPCPLEHCLRQPQAPYGITFRFDGSIAELPERRFGVAVWERGRVFYEESHGPRAEVLYLHFMGTKRWWHWLLFRPALVPADRHVFSAIGYGLIQGASGLRSPLYRAWFALLSLAESLRQVTGRLLRATVGVDGFRRLRRVVISRTRY